MWPPVFAWRSITKICVLQPGPKAWYAILLGYSALKCCQKQVLHSITWILTFQRQPHAGWKTWEIVADLPGRIYQAFSSLHLVPLLHVNLSEVGEERYSKALQQNTPKMSHGPIIARSERDKNWKVVFINRRWTPILQPVKLFLARLFSSLKLLLKSASAFFSHPTWTKFSKDKFRFVHCGPVK